jgi:hypothetical protein
MLASSAIYLVVSNLHLELLRAWLRWIVLPIRDSARRTSISLQKVNDKYC